MSKPEEESPLIFRETVKLLEEIESGEAQILESEALLEAKETYLRQVEQQRDELQKSTYEKSAQLAIIKKRTKFVNDLNSTFRDQGKGILESCNTAYQQCKELDQGIAEAEQQADKLEKMLATKKSRAEKEIEDLTKLLNQLTEKRKKKQEAVEIETKQLEQENVALKTELLKLEIEENMLDSENVGDWSGLEAEMFNLQDKLNILDHAYVSLAEEEKSLEEREKEIMAKYSEQEYAKINQRCSELSKENAVLGQNIQDLRVELNSGLAEQKELAECEQQLEKELAEATKASEIIDKDGHEENSKLDQIIEKIWADVIERKEKYEALLKVKSANSAILKETKEKLVELTPKVDLLATELTEVENHLIDLQSASGNLAEQFEVTSIKITEIDEEIAAVQKLEREKQNLIDTQKATLATRQEKLDLELLTLNNAHSAAVRDIERQREERAEIRVDLNQKVTTLDAEIKQLEEMIVENNAILEALKKNKERFDDSVKYKQQKFLNLLTKSKELNKTLDALKQPQFKFGPSQESSQKVRSPRKCREKELIFRKPKYPEPVRKLLPMKDPSKSPKDKANGPASSQKNKGAQRNWDSDSSAEEMVKFRDFVAKKKRRQDHK